MLGLVGDMRGVSRKFFSRTGSYFTRASPWSHAVVTAIVIVVDVRTVSQVVQLQLQLSYFNVLLRKLVFQPPQLVLLPEEHPQELKIGMYLMSTHV